MQTFKSLFHLVVILTLSSAPSPTAPFYATVPENAPIGRNVTGVLTTSHMGEEEVRCEIVEGNEHDRFTVSTCRITVARPLDYGVSPIYNLTVNVIRPGEYNNSVGVEHVVIQVQDVPGYPPVYNNTCETPLLNAGQEGNSGSWIFEVTGEAEIMEKHSGIILLKGRNTDPQLQLDLMDNISYSASSDCRLQFVGAHSPKNLRSTIYGMGMAHMRRSGFKCLQCFTTPEDAAVLEVAFLNADGNTECGFGSDIGRHFDYLSQRFNVVGSFRMFQSPEANKRYRFKCKVPNLTSSLPMKLQYLEYEITNFIRLESEAQVIGCPPNKYGIMCEHHCVCKNDARCHGLNGACKCQPGWQGVICDIPHSTVAIIATPSDSRQIHINGSLALQCRAFHLPVESMTWGFPNGTQKWLQRTQTDQIRIESIQPEHNGTYTCTVVTEDKTVVLVSYELQAVTCQPGYKGELCADACHCPRSVSCDRWTGCVCLGWTGVKCETRCPQGTYGQGCSSKCHCQNANCDHVNGRCDCREGWFGLDCSQPCPHGLYGLRCRHSCDCKNNAKCHHLDGNCTCESPWTGQRCDNQTNTFLLPLQISIPILLTLLVSAALVAICRWQRAARVMEDEGLDETQALLELNSIEEGQFLAQSLQPGWLNRWERKEKDLTLGQLIGIGSFAHIRKGHLCIDNTEIPVAVKSVRIEDRQCCRAFCREVAALIAVNENQEQKNGASNIVRLFGVITKSTPKYILLEYAENDDLLQLLKRLKQQNESRQNHIVLLSHLLHYAVHISRALKELRRLRIAHGDVAARNVLISGDHIAKLTDFGLAHDLYSNISHASSMMIDTEELLPLSWMALESLKCRQFTCESDVWSFGVLLWEIATLGEEPNYQQMVLLTFPGLVEVLKQGMRLQKPPGCPEGLYEVMMSCWQEEPSARPTPEELEQRLTDCQHKIDLQFGEMETTV
ncbi:uncharacterized protein LOC144874634 [Branchiostoma floridae x Branchiostoma japonicum]